MRCYIIWATTENSFYLSKIWAICFLFKLTDWCGNHRTASASMNIAKFLVPFIYNVSSNDFTAVLLPLQKL